MLRNGFPQYGDVARKSVPRVVVISGIEFRSRSKIIDLKFVGEISYVGKS